MRAFMNSSVLFLPLDCTEQHQRAKDEEHEAPDQIDVDPERGGFGALDEPKCRQKRSDEGEHEADWPADIESHKIPFRLVNGCEHTNVGRNDIPPPALIEGLEQNDDGLPIRPTWEFLRSHLIGLGWPAYQKMTFRITQTRSSTTPTTAGRCQTGMLPSTVFGVSE